MATSIVHFAAGLSDRGKRLDHFLQDRLPEHTRSRIQEWIRAGRVQGDSGAIRKPAYTLRGGERITVEPLPPPPLHATPEAIPLSILYEDQDLVAVDKPRGMVVHSGAGNRTGTLVNALLHHFSQLSTLSGEDRPGIVHRLDRYTSGALLVARNDFTHRALQDQFARRKVRKIYFALVHGQVEADQGSIETPIARDPGNRARMTARLASGRSADTHYRVLRRFEDFTYLEVLIGTGRTHQIRVHLASIGHPVCGDRLYGAPAVTPGLESLDGYFLHASSIRFTHPRSGSPMEVAALLPPDLEAILNTLV